MHIGAGKVQPIEKWDAFWYTMYSNNSIGLLHFMILTVRVMKLIMIYDVIEEFKEY